MTLPLYWTRQADDELNRAIAWYEAQRPGLGDALMTSVTDAIIDLQRHPFLGKRIEDDIRCVHLRRFPFSIFHRIEPHRIVILWFRHSRRKPVY